MKLPIWPFLLKIHVDLFAGCIVGIVYVLVCMINPLIPLCLVACLHWSLWCLMFRLQKWAMTALWRNRLKSPPHSQLANKQSPRARYECKHNREEKKRSRLSTSCSSEAHDLILLILLPTYRHQWSMPRTVGHSCGCGWARSQSEYV